MAILFLLITPFLFALASITTKKRYLLEIFGIIAVLIEFVSALFIALRVSSESAYSLLPYFSIDSLGAIIVLTITTVNLFAIFYSIGYLREEAKKIIIGPNRIWQYFILFNFFSGAMLLATATTNPVLMWIAVEATTLSTAFLISFYNKPSAMEAAWKYLIINSVGLLLGFLGTLIFVSAAAMFSGSAFISWQELTAVASKIDPRILEFAFVFILIGYGTKVGLVPMHTWKPDAYAKAPTPIVALLSGALLNVAFLAILHFKSVVDGAIGVSFTQNLLIFFGAISIILSALLIYVQKNYKRLLAYSSIEHAGLMAIGFGFGGIAAFAAIFHMIYHALAKALMFFAAGNIFLKYGSTKIEQIKGVATSLPITGIVFLIGFLIITGLPPFGIFLVEFYIFSSGVVAHPIISSILILSLALVFVGFLKHISGMVFGEAPKEVVSGLPAEFDAKAGEASALTVWPMVALLILIIALGFFLPAPLSVLLNNAVKLI